MREQKSRKNEYVNLYIDTNNDEKKRKVKEMNLYRLIHFNCVIAANKGLHTSYPIGLFLDQTCK